jgi:hypothetical protein
MTGKNETRKTQPRPEVARQIDENLKQLYAEGASAPLPDSLTQLLDALRHKEAQMKASKD